MHKIFISYRREDSAATCGRIYDRLVARFGKANVFKDVKSIPLGVDFKDYIQQVVEQCAVMLVVVGSHWLDALDANGQSRLDDPDDTARLEIELALWRDMVVIPVLVERAFMPTPEELPASLRPLTTRNGVAVRYDPDFDNDVQRVIEAIEHGLKSSSRQRHAARHTRRHLVVTGILSAALALLVTLAGAFAFLSLGGHLTAPTNLPLSGLAMTAPNDGWAVGDNGTYLHDVGGSWQRVEVPNSLPALRSISIVNGTGWAVGRNGALVRYTNGAWNQIVDTAIPPGQLEDLYSVSVVPPGGPQADAWAVGGAGTMLRYHAGTWTLVPLPDGLMPYLFGVRMISASAGWAVGENGTILQYDGLGWSVVSLPIAADLYALTVAPGGDVYAVGSGGTIAQERGGQWQIYQTATTAALLGIAMDAPDDGWAVGAAGTLLREVPGRGTVVQVSPDGTTRERAWPTTWVAARSPTSAYLYGVALTSSTEGWAVGDLGTILRYANSRWTVYGH